MAVVGTFWAAGLAVKRVSQNTDGADALFSRTRWFFIALLVVCTGTNWLPALFKSQTLGFWPHLGISVGSAVMMVGVALVLFRLCYRKR